MKKTKRLALCALLVLPLLSVAAAFPDKPVTLIVPYAPGGFGTTFGNLMSEALSPVLGQRLVTDYRPGANGGLGAAIAAKAPHDGYTLFMAVNSTMAINPGLYARLQYDPVKDFAPVAMVCTSSNVLVVNATSPFKSVQDLVDYARAHPGKLNFGSSGNGSTVHLSGEMFAKLAGVSVNHVPYKGVAPAVADLMGGQIDFMFADASVLPQVVPGGKLRALAVTGTARLGAAPELPTMQEAGLKGFAIRSWYSIVAPAGTPPEVVAALNRDIAKVVQMPAVRTRMKELGMDPAEDTSAGYLRSTIQSDLSAWKKFLAEIHIKID
jgi:tripartite-type tricarboxylate transporter receptor subunit TctC